MRYLKHTLFLSIFLLVFFALTPISHSSNIKVGFIGGRSPVGIVKQWTPLLDYLTRKVGQPFEMALFENYQDLMGAFEQKQIDIFESGAFTHLVAMDGGDAEFLAGPVRMGSPSYRSIFIVRSDSDIERLDDLKGTSLALTDELSTSGFLLPRVMLKRKGITTPAEFFEQIVLTGSHNRSIEAVLEGAVNVAGVGDSFLAHLKPESREKLRILETSGPISYGPVTVRRDLNSAIKNKIRSALLNYHKHLSADIKQVVQIDRFTNDETWDYASLRAYRDETKALPKLGYVAPYRRVPTVISDRIEDEKESALTWVISIFAVVVIILIAALRVLKRRMSSTTGITITAIVALFAALFTTINLLTLFSSINEFATRRLGQMENLNLRTVTAITGTSAESLNNILSTATRDKALVWAKIFRNGTIIASNKPSEVGVSIIDQIRTDTFDKSGDETIQVLDPIIVGKKRFATVQLGLSFAPVSGMVKRAVTINAIAMVAALLAGLVGALAIRRRIGRPVKELSQAVEKMREGETVEIANTDADLKGVTNLIAMLGKELRDKQTLIDLNSYEKLNNDAEYDPELTKLIADRLHELEEDYPRFKKIRAKQAVGDSPAWLRCMRDAAIRASDPDPTVIIGPSGSGKTSVARVIHALSPRAEKPMGEFNCAEFASADPLVVLGKLFGYGTDCGIQGIDPQSPIFPSHDLYRVLDLFLGARGLSPDLRNLS